MTIEEFTTIKRSKLLGYLVGRYYVTARRAIFPSGFTMTCFHVIAHNFFAEDWMAAVFAGRGPHSMRFVTPAARSQYIAGFSLAVSFLDITQTEAERIGVLIPTAAFVGEDEKGTPSFGGLMLSRYTRSA